MTAQDRGWGPPGCGRSQLVRVRVPGMVDTAPYFPLNVRREVAPLFAELCRWLAAERKRLGLPPLTCSGGYNKRLVRGSSTAWSNHSWGLAGDFCAATNPMQSRLRTDMPPGTSAKARSLGMTWGGDYKRRPDPMHFEFVKTPAEAARLVAGLSRVTKQATRPPSEEDQIMGAAQEIKDEIWKAVRGHLDLVVQEQMPAALAAALAPVIELVKENDRQIDMLRRDKRQEAAFLNALAAKLGMPERIKVES